MERNRAASFSKSDDHNEAPKLTLLDEGLFKDTETN